MSGTRNKTSRTLYGTSSKKATRKNPPVTEPDDFADDSDDYTYPNIDDPQDEIAEDEEIFDKFPGVVSEQHGHFPVDDIDEDAPVSEPPRKSSKPSSKKTAGSRVLGGYKATLKNPKVSQEAKDHAQQVLEENGAA